MNAGIFLVPTVHEIAIAAELAIAAKAGEKSDANALTQRPALDAETKSIDAPHNFMPRNARPVNGKERFDGGCIRVADPTGFDANPHVTWTGIQKSFVTSENFPGPESSMALYVAVMVLSFDPWP